jgi:formate/nitrite transporter FocA (FNT family)
MAAKTASKIRLKKRGITQREVRDVEEMAAPRQPVIYEIVRRQGEEELQRPAVSLWWSGIAAGLSISFSLLAQAVLQTHLPDAQWKPLVVALGYSVGFLMVVLSRQQLFTESTITAVLPVAKALTQQNVMRLLRLWGIVLAANLAGTLLAALFCTYSQVLPDELFRSMLQISRDTLIDQSWGKMFFAGIASGFIIAAMVWMLPGSEGNQFQVIALMTWLIGVGGYTHIVAGGVEAFMLLLDGQFGVGSMLWQFIIPVLLGNIVGGTALFAVLSYAQVMKEI